ncbi:transcriptional regulator, LysR family protein [Oceanicola granulosus HTCC2516]|uniref:Transcriptional regulator, LysR family protein n=1 Tax=Oceanicola granulosus (strain ATCC BAA-861 / DSM 15982 / KCTC 12143 / HTCC2516) TaxID=314256 RepID=Q2CCM2_OCEGH|nr:LysR family transcriptional regulator [Oceanicola granulosus]EAR50391.1 transcriptional regulator, LysR family protein [Oceanicola granulosus HTCC2516]
MNLAGFDLNLLKVLDALLRERSTTRAAARVGLSQPAVSAALGRLRAALGDELFLRRGQGLVATDFARALEAPLRETLDRLEDLLAAPQEFDPATAKRTFRLAGIDFFAEMLMPQLAARLAAAAPGVRIQLLNLVPREYEATLERYEADVALFPLTGSPEWAEHRLLFRSPFVLAAAAGNPRLAHLAEGDTVPLDLFCDLGHILFSLDGNLRAMGDDALAAVGRQRRVVMSMASFPGILRAVAGSEAVSLVPVQLARKLQGEMGLRCFALPMPLEPPVIGMMWHRRSSATPAHAWLREQIVELMTPLNAGLAPL